MKNAFSRWQDAAARGCGLALMSLYLGILPAAAHVPVPQTIAVIYTDADADIDGEFSHLISGIQRTSQVVIYRLALDADSAATGAALRTAAANHAVTKVALHGPGGIAVIYPDIGEPYRSVFSKIIEGIEEKARTRVVSYPVGAQLDALALMSELRRQDIRVVIALGRNGLRAATALDRNIGIIAGGIIYAPDAPTRDMAVHSLAPDPHLLFARLKAMMPAVRRVFVVYDARQNAWLIRLAQEAAKMHGLELSAIDAPDLKAATRHYQDIFSLADARKDALWLPQDSTTVEESSVLPMILQESWSRGVAVFSSSVGHVRRGALFALYPNNVELGRNLASTALSHLATSPLGSRGVTPLKEVLVAVNVRTASHLGLMIGAKPMGIDLVFPEQ